MPNISRAATVDGRGMLRADRNGRGAEEVSLILLCDQKPNREVYGKFFFGPSTAETIFQAHHRQRERYSLRARINVGLKSTEIIAPAAAAAKRDSRSLQYGSGSASVRAYALP